MAAEFILEVKHITGERSAIYLVGFLLLVVLAYLVVLAVTASEVAVAEEDCPRTPVAG